MNPKNAVLVNVYERMKLLQRLDLEYVDIYDDNNQQGESHKAEEIYLNYSDNVVYVNLDNGDEIPLEELSYNELIAIYEELV